MEEQTSWKIHLRSPFEAKLNIFKDPAKIDHTSLKAKNPQHAEAFKEGGALETALTDIMLEICGFTNEGFASSSYELYLVDQKFVHNKYP